MSVTMFIFSDMKIFTIHTAVHLLHGDVAVKFVREDEPPPGFENCDIYLL